MRPIRVIAAEDHELVRAGFRALLNELSIEVVAEASDGNQVLELVKIHQPDVVLMDIAMPGLNGLDATVRVVQEYPNVRVIILSVYANPEYVRRVLRLGAVGYLLKTSSVAELDLAIKAAVRGETYLSPAVAKFIATAYAQYGSREGSSFELLSPRQLEIVQLLAKGYSRKQIADRLGISVKTFDNYRAQIMKQLDIQDVAGLVRYASQMGLLTPDD